MEEQSSIPDLQIDEFAQNSLRDTTKWTRFLSIVFCILMGLMVFGVVAMFLFKDTVTQAFNESSRFSEIGAGTGVVMTIIGVMVVISLAVFAMITYNLMRFSTETQKGIDQQNQTALESGIGALKNYMVISGILGILGLLFGLLQLIAIL